jgi:histidinol phosphatase-like enzyme
MQRTPVLIIWDRDGTQIGDPKDYLANNPRNLLRDTDEAMLAAMRFIAAAQVFSAHAGRQTTDKRQRLVFQGGASNQGGIYASEGPSYLTLEQAYQQFAHILKNFPNLDVAMFCPDGYGQYCQAIYPDGTRVAIHEQPQHQDKIGTFRKEGASHDGRPGIGMLLAVKEELETRFGITFAPENCYYIGDHDGVNQPKMVAVQDPEARPSRDSLIEINGAMYEMRTPDDKDIQSAIQAGFRFIPVMSVIQAVESKELFERDFSALLNALAIQPDVYRAPSLEQDSDGTQGAFCSLEMMQAYQKLSLGRE